MLKKTTLLQNMSATTIRCNDTVQKPYNFVKQLLIMLQFKGARLSRNNVGDIKVFLEGLVGFEVNFIVNKINENLHFLSFS